MAVHGALIAASVPTVSYAVERSIATITLDSPANRNALSAELVAALTAALATATADDSVRAIVVTHTGSTFCSGNDLREASTANGAYDSTRRLVDLLARIIEAPKPVIARVDGHVRAGGIGLVEACDIAIGSTATTFAFTEVRLGLAPAVISLTTLPRMQARAASRYLLTGEVVDGRTAADVGLLTECADDLEAAMTRVLAALRLAAPGGLAATKATVTASMRAQFAERADQLQQLSAALFASEQAAEGMQAFLQKRPPDWVESPR